MKQILKFILFLTILCVFVFGVSTGFFANAETLSQSVYLGGVPIGVIAKSKGVTVLDITDVITSKGTIRPAEAGGIQKGDLIIKINNFDIISPEDIGKALETAEGSVTVTVLRMDETIELTVKPEFDIISKAKKLGLQVRNEIAGVGTLTYVRADNKRFGGLGHQICDSDARNKDIYSFGSVFKCDILGVIKGEQGKAGELRGSFKRSEEPVGKLDKNTFTGIFGSAESKMYEGRPMIAVGSRHSVVPGKAYIYTTVKGGKPEKYEIEIVKAVRQNACSDKSMVISIKDQRLLNETGGIVQGMSGSPIIQNGKLIGAVTHVFINDPTRGYGIYLDWMLSN